MGEVIGFKRKKLAVVSNEVPPPINLAEPVTADKLPAWDRGEDTARPRNIARPQSDGA